MKLYMLFQDIWINNTISWTHPLYAPARIVYFVTFGDRFGVLSRKFLSCASSCSTYDIYISIATNKASNAKPREQGSLSVRKQPWQNITTAVNQGESRLGVRSRGGDLLIDLRDPLYTLFRDSQRFP